MPCPFSPHLKSVQRRRIVLLDGGPVLLDLGARDDPGGARGELGGLQGEQRDGGRVRDRHRRQPDLQRPRPLIRHFLDLDLQKIRK
jgi:hypothetical protein